jgi:hypothetical protein
LPILTALAKVTGASSPDNCNPSTARATACGSRPSPSRMYAFAGQFRDDTENQAMKINDFLTLEIIIAGGSFIGAVIVLGVTYYFFYR